MESTKSQSLADAESSHCSADTPPPSPSTKKQETWETCLDYAKSHAKGEVEVWKDEVGNLLIFATLFSSIAGAFAVDSYHSVKEDPAETTVLLLKSLLALQLNATNPQPQTNIPIDLDATIPITASARRINLYNFLSLILSLVVVMAGILCLQWLREYDQDPSGIPRPRREHLGIRYMRNEGLKKWGVFTVLKMLPVILLLSVFLFFAGIIELLLGVDRTAAIVASVTIGAAAAFMVVTTVTPTLLTFCLRLVGRHGLSQCPWKSPQAWMFYQVFGAPLHAFISAIRESLGRNLPSDTKSIFNFQDWSMYDWLFYKDSDVANVGFGIHWLGTMYLQEKKLAKALYNCIQDTAIHDSLQKLLSIRKDDDRAASINRALQWMPPATTDTTLQIDQKRAAHIAEVTVFQTLAHLAQKIEQGHPPTILFEERLDLFFNINELRRDKGVDCPLMNDMDQRALIPYETRKKVLKYIFELMGDENAGINESHLIAIEHILELETNSHEPQIQLFNDAQRALSDWMESQSDDEKEDIPSQSNDEPVEDADSSLQKKARKALYHVNRLQKLIIGRQQAANPATVSQRASPTSLF